MKYRIPHPCLQVSIARVPALRGAACGAWMAVVGLLAAGAGCSGSGPRPADEWRRPHGEHIAAHWTVDRNPTADTPLTTTLTLTNEGAVPLGSEGWTLYFNFPRMIDPDRVTPGVRIRHVNGDLFALEPDSTFVPLETGEAQEISFEAEAWVINASEAPAGLYFVFTGPNGQRSEPEPVGPYTVGPFERDEQTMRSPADRVPVVTPALRYAHNRPLALMPADQVVRITPTPVRIRPGPGTVVLDQSTRIVHGPGLDGEAGLLADVLERLLGVRPPVASESGGPAASTAGTIALRTAPVWVGGARRGQGDAAYRLTATPAAGVEILGSDPAGVFYGTQSLLAWLPVEAFAAAQLRIEFDAVMVQDAPRFGYRGMHLDVARNFQAKETVVKLLDLMAFYKLNRFHFHLTDDEGWRLEIGGLPELTEVGARRGHTTDERDRLLPSFGSGPDPDTAPGSGFYTRQDFIDMLRHAHERHIEVIPEIDMPGHARAAIRAMEARHARLAAVGDPDSSAFRLVHPDDASTYRSVQLWTDNVIDVCLPSTYRFLERVVDALMVLYDEAGAPLTTVHTGGDEVPEGVWTGSPACRALIAEPGNGVDGPDDLWTYYVGRFNDLLTERGLVTAGWEEIAMLHGEEGADKQPNPAFVGQDVRPYFWNSVWGWGAEDHGYKLANAGYPVVLSNASNLYFDLAYEKHPDEPGYYWAGFVDTRKAFEFAPFNIYRSAWTNSNGERLTAADFAGHELLRVSARGNILGIQGQLWGENAKSAEQMEYLVFPKLIGLAERAWAEQPVWARLLNPVERRAWLERDWNRFANRLGQRELPRLDALHGGVAYRLPPPGAAVEDGLLRANVAFPGLPIRFTINGGPPTAQSPLYTEPLALDGVVRLRTFDTRGRGSRTVTITP